MVAFSINIYDIPAMQVEGGKFVQNNPHLLPQLYLIIFMIHSARLFNALINIE